MIARLALNLAIAALPAVVFVFGAAKRSQLPYTAFYRSFAAGLLAVFPALALMLLVSSALSGVGGLPGDALRAFVVAGLVEEVVKLAPVRWSMRGAEHGLSRGAREAPARDARARAAGIAVAAGLEAPAPEQPPLLPLAVTAGLGFAFLENAFYLAGSSSLLVTRALLAVPLHGATAAYLGLAVTSGVVPPGSGRRGFNRRGFDRRGAALGSDPRGAAEGSVRRSVPYSVPAALVLAAFVHGAYDLAVKRAAPLAPIVVVGAIALAVALARHRVPRTP